MNGLLSAVSFLTRVPVPGPHRDPAASVKWFPVIGGLVGLFVAGIYALLYDFAPSPLAATVAVVGGVILTGAFHEDGLADSMDAIGSRARGDRGLEIMKDPRLGSYGTLAMVISVLWRVLALAALTPAIGAAAMVMAHTLGRGGAVVLMASTPPARLEGLGVIGATTSVAWFAAVSSFVISVVAGGWWVAPAIGVVALTVLWLRGVAVARFQGITGDILGAGEQMGEMLVLAVVTGLAWNGSELWWDALVG